MFGKVGRTDGIDLGKDGPLSFANGLGTASSYICMYIANAQVMYHRYTFMYVFCAHVCIKTHCMCYSVQYLLSIM